MPSIVYNSYNLPKVIKKFNYNEDEKSINVSCEFLVTAASAGGLVTACQAAEEALTEINKNFSLSFGGSSELSFSHSANTGFLARPKLTKLKNKLATACSRPYSFSVNIQLPFAQSGYNYRREASFSITYAPTRQRTVNFRCLYTAGGVNSALQNYLAGTGGKAWAATILSALGGNYELISENISEEHEQKILNASFSYKEILAKQSSASLNVAAIVDPRASYSCQIANEVGMCVSNAGYLAVPVVTIAVNYSCRIDFDQVPDEVDIEDVYQTTVKPWLIAHTRDILGLSNYSQAGSQYIIQSESKNIDPHNYVVSGTLTFTAPQTMSSIIRLDENLSTSDDFGISATKIWDGNAHTYNTWGIGAKRSLSRSISIARLGQEPAVPVPYTDGSSGKWMLLSRRKNVNKKRIGSGTTVSGARSEIVWFAHYNESYMYVEPFGFSG